MCVYIQYDGTESIVVLKVQGNRPISDTQINTQMPHQTATPIPCGVQLFHAKSCLVNTYRAELCVGKTWPPLHWRRAARQHLQLRAALEYSTTEHARVCRHMPWPNMQLAVQWLGQ